MAIIEITRDDETNSHGFEIGTRVEARIEEVWDELEGRATKDAVVLKDEEEWVIYEDEYKIIEDD